MDNIIDLEEYRSQKIEREIESLKSQISELTVDMDPILPDMSMFSTVYDERYMFEDSYFTSLNSCPHCGCGYYSAIDTGDTDGS